MKIKVGAVVGPTASGKTALAIELAKRVNGEIISCDSMQIYKKMDIGTAKPTIDEMGEIPHHLIDIVEPSVNFSCADYSVLAKEKIEEITARGKIPIFCGGTGLYVDHVLSNTVFSDAGKDDGYREMLQKRIEDNGIEPVFEELKKVDPDSAAVIHPNNTKRVIRALEIYHVTGKTKSEWDRESKKQESDYDSRIIFLDYKDRDKLYARIDKRVDIMMEAGLLCEVKNLVKEGQPPLSDTAMQGIGYKEIIDYLNGNISLDDAIEQIKRYSRNYAKRQITWFKRYENCCRIFVDEYNDFYDIVKIAENEINH